MTLQSEPVTLTTSVRRAVTSGAWSPGDVTATVTSEVRAARSDVLATLWDLVEAGELVYDAHSSPPSFRAASPSL